MNIYLVRHGEDEDNAAGILNGRRDTPLTALGEEQASKVAKELQGESIVFDVIMSSPLQRARQTAEAIAEVLGKDVAINSELIERDYGVLTGKLRTDIEKYSTGNIDVDGLLYFLNAKDAESFEATYERAAKLLESLKGSNYTNVIMVAHRDICIMIQAAFYDWGWLQGIKNAHMKNASVLKLSEQSN
ncbi:MAG: histidine phosphatase family protein [Candidatus Saccharimonadales bacterium]